MARVEAVFELRDRMSRNLDRIRERSERAERMINRTDAAVKKLGQNDGVQRMAQKFDRSAERMRRATNDMSRQINTVMGHLRALGAMTARPKIELRGAAEAMRQISAIQMALKSLKGGGAGIPPPGVPAGLAGGGGGGSRGGSSGARLSFGPVSIPTGMAVPLAGAALLGPVLGTGLGALGGMAGAGVGALGAGAGAGLAGMAGLYGGGAVTAAGVAPAVKAVGAATKAIGDYRTEMKAAAGDSDRMAAATKKMEEALRGVPAQTREAARNVLQLKEAYKQAFGEGRRYAAVMGTIERATGFAASRGLDMLTQSFDRFFPVFDRAANSMMDFFESPQGIREFRQWTEGLPAVADNMLKMGGAAARMFGGIIRGFTPLATQMSGGLANWFGKAADWANSTRGMRRMEELGAAALPIFKSLGNAMVALGKGMGQLLVGNSGRALTYFIDRVAGGIPGFVDGLNRAARETPKFVELLSDIGKTMATLFGPNTAFDIGIRMLNNMARSVRMLTEALGPLGPALMAGAGVATVGRLVGGMQGRGARTAGGALLGGTLLGPMGALLGGGAFARMSPMGQRGLAGGGMAGVGLAGGGMGGAGLAGGMAGGMGAGAGGSALARNLAMALGQQPGATNQAARAMMQTLGLGALGMAGFRGVPALGRGLGALRGMLPGAAALVGQNADIAGRAGVGQGAAASGRFMNWLRGTTLARRPGSGPLLGRLMGFLTGAGGIADAREITGLPRGLAGLVDTATGPISPRDLQRLAAEEARTGRGRLGGTRAAYQAARSVPGTSLRGAAGAALRGLNPFTGGAGGFLKGAGRLLGGPVGIGLTAATAGLGLFQYLNRDQGGGGPQLPMGTFLDDPRRLEAERFRGAQYSTTQRRVPVGPVPAGYLGPRQMRTISDTRYSTPHRFRAEEARLGEMTSQRAEEAREIQTAYREITRELARQERLQKKGRDNEAEINSLVSARRSLVQQLEQTAPTAVTYGMFGRATGVNQKNLNRLTLGLEAGQTADPGRIARRFGDLNRRRQLAGDAEQNLMSKLSQLAPGMDLNAVQQAARSGDLRSLEVLERQAGAMGGPRAQNAFKAFQDAIKTAGGTYGNFISRLRDLAPLYDQYMVQPAQRAAKKVSDKAMDRLIESDGRRGRGKIPKWLRNLVGDARDQPELRGLARRTSRTFITGVVENLGLKGQDASRARRALYRAMGLNSDGRVPTAKPPRKTPAEVAAGDTKGDLERGGGRDITDPQKYLDYVNNLGAGHQARVTDTVTGTPANAKREASQVARAATKEMNASRHQADAKRGGRRMTQRFKEGVRQPIEEVQKGGKDIAHVGQKGMGDKDKAANAQGHGRHLTNQYARGIESKAAEARRAARKVVDAANSALDPGAAPAADPKPHGGPIRDNAGNVVGGMNNGKAYKMGQRKGQEILTKAKAAAAAVGGVPTGSAGPNLQAAIAKARELGLSVTSFMRPNDKDSLHSTGRAVDLSNGVNTPEMAAFYKWALRHFRYVEELFYDPLGGVDKNRQIGAIGGHSDHVHIAFRGGGRVPGRNKWKGDNVRALLSPNEVVLTDHGQQLMDAIAGPGTVNRVVEQQRAHFGGGGFVGDAGRPRGRHKLVGQPRRGGVTLQINGPIQVSTKEEYESFVRRLAKDLELASMNSPMDFDHD